MTEYFLVNKDIEDMRSKDGEWQDVSPSAIKKAAKITTKMVKLCKTEEEAIAECKGEIRGTKETDFYPYFRVEVADGAVPNKKSQFNRADVKVTHFSLSHIDASYAAYKNVDITTLGRKKLKADAESSKEVVLPAASATVAASRLSGLRRFVPAANLTNAKHVLGLGAVGAAYYFGNPAVADLVAKTGYAIPEMVTSSAGASVSLPVAAGLVTRLATELPQWIISGVVAAGKKIGTLCKAGKAKWDARKASKVTAITAPNAGVAQVSQLAAALEQFNDVSEERVSANDDLSMSPKAITYSKKGDSSESLHDLVPQKQTATSEATLKPTFH